MQLVFIHGVATRREPDADAYDGHVAARRRNFAEISLEGVRVDFHDPYWGGAGVRGDAVFLSVPRGPGTPLAIGGPAAERAVADMQALSGDLLLQAARADFAAVLNTLSIELLRTDDEAARATGIAIGEYAAEREGADGAVVPPTWLVDPTIGDDEAFLRRLRIESGVTQDAALGLGDRLRGAARRLLGAAVGIVDGPAERLARDLSPGVARFLGDVFVYLQDGGRREDIRREVGAALAAAAAAAAANDEPLVVVGHSMGGVILYDMLTDPDVTRNLETRIGREFSIDLLLSVGTQIGLFQELSLFEATADVKPAPRPRPVRRWWHVYNVMDVLSFGVNGVFSDVDEFSVDTRANIMDAHGAYFASPVFHKRLRKRLKGAGLIA